jgi:hypothetical protein
LEQVTRSAGVRIWEWDVVRNTMHFSGDLAEVYDAEIAAADKKADAMMLNKVHPEDRARSRSRDPRFGPDHRHDRSSACRDVAGGAGRTADSVVVETKTRHGFGRHQHLGKGSQNCEMP